MTERILVVDPGERFGWCHATVTEGSEFLGREGISTYTRQVFDLEVTGHGITEWKPFVLKLHEVIASYDTVILESYRIYSGLAKQHVGSDVPTLQGVGQVKLCAWLNPHVKLVMQAPSVQKNGEKVAPPAIREILERLPKSHDEAHDGSALRHLSHYWFQNYAS